MANNSIKLIHGVLNLNFMREEVGKIQACFVEENQIQIESFQFIYIRSSVYHGPWSMSKRYDGDHKKMLKYAAETIMSLKFRAALFKPGAKVPKWHRSQFQVAPKPICSRILLVLKKKF